MKKFKLMKGELDYIDGILKIERKVTYNLRYKNNKILSEIISLEGQVKQLQKELAKHTRKRDSNGRYTK